MRFSSRRSWIRGNSRGQPSVSRFNLTGVRQDGALAEGRFSATHTVDALERRVRACSDNQRQIDPNVAIRRREGLERLDCARRVARVYVLIISRVNRLGGGTASLCVCTISSSEEPPRISLALTIYFIVKSSPAIMRKVELFYR